MNMWTKLSPLNGLTINMLAVAGFPFNLTLETLFSIFNKADANDMGFLATKALGYDTFAAFNRKNKSFFVNTMEKNIDEVAKRLSEIAPGTQNIRGVMVFPPKDRKGLENMTEEKFLEILKLKKG